MARAEAPTPVSEHRPDRGPGGALVVRLRRKSGRVRRWVCPRHTPDPTGPARELCRWDGEAPGALVWVKETQLLLCKPDYVISLHARPEREQREFSFCFGGIPNPIDRSQRRQVRCVMVGLNYCGLSLRVRWPHRNTVAICLHPAKL